MAISVPFIKPDDFQRIAESFLADHHRSRALPVPIEEIIDVQFGIDIIPMPGFSENYEVDAFISTDLTEIRVDQGIYRAKSKNRYRFSLAHELSHRLLHESIFRQLIFETAEQWKSARDAIDASAYSRLEFQANELAGRILVPGQELRERFDKAVDAATRSGIDIQRASAEAWDNIARYLGSEFGVSIGVIDRRAIKEGLWEGKSM